MDTGFLFLNSYNRSYDGQAGKVMPGNTGFVTGQ